MPFQYKNDINQKQFLIFAKNMMKKVWYSILQEQAILFGWPKC